MNGGSFKEKVLKEIKERILCFRRYHCDLWRCCAFEMEIRIFYHICDEVLCAETVIRNYHLILGKSYGSITFNKVYIFCFMAARTSPWIEDCETFSTICWVTKLTLWKNWILIFSRKNNSEWLLLFTFATNVSNRFLVSDNLYFYFWILKFTSTGYLMASSMADFFISRWWGIVIFFTLLPQPSIKSPRKLKSRSQRESWECCFYLWC